TSIIVTVPACSELWSSHDAFCGHYRRYSLAMLDALAVELNWTVKRKGYFFRIPYMPMLLLSLLGIKRDTRIDPPGKVSRPIHRLVSAACRLEQAILPPGVRGSSAYAVYSPGRSA